jgi:hypothetical protein
MEYFEREGEGSVYSEDYLAGGRMMAKEKTRGFRSTAYEHDLNCGYSQGLLLPPSLKFLCYFVRCRLKTPKSKAPKRKLKKLKRTVALQSSHIIKIIILIIMIFHHLYSLP